MDVIHSGDAHLTADEIINFVQARMPGVNKSTIYRTLELLEEAGCVYRSTLEGHDIYHHADEGHHHHLICATCGKTISCDEDLFASVKTSLQDKYGFRVDFRHIIMRGCCRECQRAAD